MKFANDNVLHFTLREMQRILSKPQFWAILGGVVLIATISGPFSTLHDFTLIQRFAYWLSIVVLTAITANATGIYFSHLLRRKGARAFLQITITAFAVCIPVTFIVWSITAYIAGTTDGGLMGLIHFIPNTAPICFVIVITYAVLSRKMDEQDGGQKEIMFLKRLPVKLGRTVYSLQAQDHYVQVTTSRGKEFILIRLEDAINEIEGIDGLRVHRSWWVSRDAVIRFEKNENKAHLILKNEDIVPVSRTYMKAARTMFSN